ncbi:excalibur calcium-binding domain-containing protein [Gordonia soli]|uniref:Excalibur calcium-binding domain-containing protein n=1 Tax=Gordonia soli NBRC 108243 TaxID=1223545 RepID=M0QJS9_9ACTN|nr:excalibur calcium-binding domain-containing protein [Gordonia soli]GAC67697.1 hypothetical protein GS4_09_00110 [Gordonia soli NBRC 108243]
MIATNTGLDLQVKALTMAYTPPPAAAPTPAKNSIAKWVLGGIAAVFLMIASCAVGTGMSSSGADPATASTTTVTDFATITETATQTTTVETAGQTADTGATVRRGLVPDRTTAVEAPDYTPPTTTPYTPPTTDSSPSSYYSNCSEARAAGDAPLYAGQPGYRAKLDRDGDGVACE